MTGTPPRPFADLPQEQQVRLLASLLTDVLPRFGLRGEPQLVQRGYNATFRVDDPSIGAVALRCNLDSPHDATQVAGEVAWVGALADAGFAVPRPVPTSDGTVPTIAVPGLRADTPVVAYRWVEGPDLADLLADPERREEGLAALRGLGATMAALHEHAEGFTLPAGASRPHYDDWLLGSEDHLAEPNGAWATASVVEVLDAARAVVEGRVGDLLSDRTGHRLVHADLHPWNAKPGPDGPVVFDFDDCGSTAPAMDVAVAVYYLRKAPAAEEAFLTGLAGAGRTGAALAALTARPEHEALLAGRQLLMLTSVVGSPSGGDGEIDPVAFAEETRRRLAYWLEHDRFLLDPPD